MSIAILSKILSIIVLNLVLSGDNAVVIALATRKLPASSQNKAIVIGTAGAVVLRILLMLIAIELLTMPYVKIIGAILLFYIAYDLLKTNEEETEVKSETTLLSAIRTIIIADLVMSLDNVLAIAGVADGHFMLAGLGLIISIPIVIFGSQVILKLMDRFPWLIWVGALLIAYTAGSMLVEDHFIHHLLRGLSNGHIASLASCVLLAGMYFLFNRKKS
ncbi:TerC family protein [Enterococcus avium]|uniref:TerC family protein n=1 Tax=Enterococcus avium TaxID=33945 RepID=UPI002A918E92|nr:TerC family protein [Enterococcus avium]MDY6440300.1 TerC family protein [Enterococcus avium]MDY6446020.1 TerC family protein [Enterococcus avium]MDY6452538.1 TerC family protein [Enterococcus avium]MDY6472735.1 TerC family protein [Enterococcus avium]